MQANLYKYLWSSVLLVPVNTSPIDSYTALILNNADPFSLAWVYLQLWDFCYCSIPSRSLHWFWTGQLKNVFWYETFFVYFISFLLLSARSDSLVSSVLRSSLLNFVPRSFSSIRSSETDGDTEFLTDFGFRFSDSQIPISTVWFDLSLTCWSMVFCIN